MHKTFKNCEWWIVRSGSGFWKYKSKIIKCWQTTFYYRKKMYGKENATAPVIVLAKCPPLDELLTISICITKCLNNTSSTFQPHVIRCRQVLYIMSYSKTLYDCISFYRKYSLHNLGYLFLQQSWVFIGLLKIHIIYICLIPFIVLNIIHILYFL